jgi:hypothetical protein
MAAARKWPVTNTQAITSQHPAYISRSDRGAVGGGILDTVHPEAK